MATPVSGQVERGGRAAGVECRPGARACLRRWLHTVLLLRGVFGRPMVRPPSAAYADTREDRGETSDMGGRHHEYWRITGDSPHLLPIVQDADVGFCVSGTAERRRRHGAGGAVEAIRCMARACGDGSGIFRASTPGTRRSRDVHPRRAARFASWRCRTAPKSWSVSWPRPTIPTRIASSMLGRCRSQTTRRRSPCATATAGARPSTGARRSRRSGRPRPTRSRSSVASSRAGSTPCDAPTDSSWGPGRQLRLSAVGLRRRAHRSNPSGDGDRLRAVHRARAARKALASLDVLSDGRLSVGVGMVWMPEEYAAAGVPYKRRGARMDACLRCLKVLWTEDPSSSPAISTPCRARTWHREDRRPQRLDVVDERLDGVGVLGVPVHNDGGPAVLKDVGELIAVQARVDRHCHQAGTPGTVKHLRYSGRLRITIATRSPGEPPETTLQATRHRRRTSRRTLRSSPRFRSPTAIAGSSGRRRPWRSTQMAGFISSRP